MFAIEHAPPTPCTQNMKAVEYRIYSRLEKKLPPLTRAQQEQSVVHYTVSLNNQLIPRNRLLVYELLTFTILGA